MIASIQELLQKEAQAVLNIPVTDAYEKAVELIVEQVHRKKGKLVTSGMGKAGQIAMNIATTFCSTGIPSVFLHPSEAQHGDLGILQENDLLLLISNSGKTRNCRVDTIGAQPESPAEVYRYYGKSGQSAGAGIGCMPQHGKPQGGLHTGHDSYHFHNGNDRYRRYSGRADHAENRIYH